MDIVSVYQDVKDRVNSNENGQLSISLFNRFSRIGELRAMDWLSGDVENKQTPMPDLSQKNRDWIAPFLKTEKLQVQGGLIVRPKDYYKWDNAWLLGNFSEEVDCGEQGEDHGCRSEIELVNTQKFYSRCRTAIEGLKPSFQKPIAKAVGRKFEFMPRDLGSIELQYLRYPIFGSIAVMNDPVYNRKVADPANSTDYEWDEYARELLVWFITDSFANRNSNRTIKDMNDRTGKVVRDQKQA
jgi:hypothetical protein